MIIFGTRTRHKTIDSGEFFCPHCQKTRPYAHKKGKNYFALYFIPIFPMGEAGEFIECQRCGRTYDMQVLDYKPAAPPQPDAARLLNTVKNRLERGDPVEYVVSDLTAEGLDRDIANNIVKMTIGDERRECPNCNLTYAPSVKLCRDCNQWLENA